MKPFANPYYRGPVSEHFDGKRFFNPGGEMPASLRAIWEWQRSGKRERWPSDVPSPLPLDVPPAIKRFCLDSTAQDRNCIRASPPCAVSASSGRFAGTYPAAGHSEVNAP